jgi:glycosyltransferase involved in cell wall biosynthesis
MSTRPTLSFVVPSYNQASYLRACVDSCLAQRIVGATIYVVDGGSTDGSKEILASYGDRIHWRSERDRGQSDAINQGVNMADGEIVAWINSDDAYPHEHVLADVLDAFAADQHCDIVHGDGMIIDVAGRPLRRYVSRRVDVAELWARPTSLPQPSVFFRRQLFLDAGALREDLHYAMDLDLWLRLFARARATRYLPQVLSLIRTHPDAKTQRGMLKQIVEVWRIRHGWAREHGIDLRTRVRGTLADAELLAYWAAVQTGLVRAT